MSRHTNTNGKRTRATTPSAITGRIRAWWHDIGLRGQVAVLVVCAILTSAVMLLLNPFASTPSAETTTASAGGGGRTKPDDRATRKGSPSMADPGFDGTPTEIGQQVQKLLDDPEDESIDSMATVLYRYGDKDLARASVVYDSIGAGETAPRVRIQARDWWRKASAAAADQRYKDLETQTPGLLRAARNLERMDGGVPDQCSTLPDVAKQAERLVAKGTTSDYRTLTDMQQRAMQAVSGCSSDLDADTIAQVFGQPQTNTGKGDGQ